MVSHLLAALRIKVRAAAGCRPPTHSARHPQIDKVTRERPPLRLQERASRYVVAGAVQAAVLTQCVAQRRHDGLAIGGRASAHAKTCANRFWLSCSDSQPQTCTMIQRRASVR